jgi:hypothetical protein
MASSVDKCWINTPILKVHACTCRSGGDQRISAFQRAFVVGEIKGDERGWQVPYMEVGL